MISISSVRIEENETIVTCTNNNIVKVYTVHNGEIYFQNTIIGHSGVITNVSISPDTMMIATCSEDKTIRVWDSMSGVSLFTLLGHKKWVYSVSFSHDNTQLVSGSGDNTVRLWNIKRKMLIRTMRGHTDTVSCVKFNKDSTEIVSSSCDFDIYLWNAKNGKIIKKFVGHDYIVCNVNFNHNCDMLISASLDGTVRLWDIKTGTTLIKFQIKNDISRYAMVSPSGNLVISHGNRKIFVWSTITCQLLKTLECHDNKVDLIAFNENGSSFYSCGIDEENDIFELFEQKIPKYFK